MRLCNFISRSGIGIIKDIHRRIFLFCMSFLYNHEFFLILFACIFYHAPHFELPPQTLLLQLAQSRHPRVTQRFCLVLLHSCPDTVHRFLLHKTQTSSPLIEGSFAAKSPQLVSPRCSGLQVQGTAISPAAWSKLLYRESAVLSSFTSGFYPISHQALPCD